MTTLARRDDPQDRVLDAAAALFRARGFSATTVREIAAAAGILPGSLHYRFATKESLLVALMERAVEHAMAAVREAVAGSRDPLERLRLGLRAHMRILLSGDAAIYVLLYEWRSLTGGPREAIVRLRDRYEAFWDGLLHHAAGAGYLRDGVDLGLLRLFSFGAINWAAQWYSPEGKLTPDQIADAFWTFTGLGVLNDDARPANMTELRELPPTALRNEEPRRK
ncbi:MAG: TetR/AcrR family transcriptional regulator [Thermoanaerobaculia bacterium]